MKRLIVKTAGITLACIIVFCVTAYFAVALISPRTVADAWESVNSYSMCVRYLEKQYNRTGEVGDLAYLCTKINGKTDASAKEKLSRLLADDGFSAYAENADGSGSYMFTTTEYFSGKLALACYYSVGLEDALDSAENSVKTFGYTENSAFYCLIIGADDLTAEQLSAIGDRIGALEGLSEDEQVFANRDISFTE